MVPIYKQAQLADYLELDLAKHLKKRVTSSAVQRDHYFENLAHRSGVASRKAIDWSQ